MIEMYDSVDVGQIPRRPAAVAGYVDGLYRNYDALRQRFPRAHVLSITVLGGVAHCVDVEPGDVHPAQAGAWVTAMRHRRIWRPVVYASLSTMPAVSASLRRHGLQRADYRLWVAHYDGQPQIPLGYDAKQYTDHAKGRNLDASICWDEFFGITHPAPRRHWRPHLPRRRG